jgi:hypothetical protein
VSAGEAGAADDGFADKTCDVPPLSPALSVEFAACVSGDESLSLPQAPSMPHKDMAISAPAKRLRSKVAVGFDTADMECLQHGGGSAEAFACQGQRCRRIIADCVSFVKLR